jgi:hypothetical protein
MNKSLETAPGLAPAEGEMLRLAIMAVVTTALFVGCFSERAPLLVDTPPGYEAMMADAAPDQAG